MASAPELVVTFLSGSVVGSFAGGWLARWTEREGPLRDEMIAATDAYVGALWTALMCLAAMENSASNKPSAVHDAQKACEEALGSLGRLHVLFAEETYQQAEMAAADVRAVVAEGGVSRQSTSQLEAAYRHLRAFADCAGSEIRRPSGWTRSGHERRKRDNHIARQFGDGKPPSPLFDRLLIRSAEEPEHPQGSARL